MTLIRRILELEGRMRCVFAADRSNPLLALNLTIRQLKILLILSLHGEMPAHELTQSLGVGAATVTGIVDRLVAQELVIRGEDPHDRRVRRIALTARGRRLTEDIQSAGIMHLRRLLERLDAETLAAMEFVLTRLVAAAEDELATRQHANDAPAARPFPAPADQ
jgi:DNA-binding MarR family transcriptional regulator